VSKSNHKLYLVAGEASGDMHGANLIKSLLYHRPELKIKAWGGDLMQAAGAELGKHYRELAFMGFIEVLRNLRTILRNFATIKADILAYKPDALVLIDYPGFNLRLAKWAKSNGIPVIYYISPQIWAWHQSRVHQIKAHIDLMLVILPFEQDFYAKYHMKVHYVGHPLLDALEIPKPNAERTEAILLMPGSRMQEVTRLLPIMLQTAASFQQMRMIVAIAPSLPLDLYQGIIAQQDLGDRVELVSGKAHYWMTRAKIGLIKSGTSTLEAALHRLPMVVCYKGNKISYLIAKQLIKVKYISLVNLILDKPLVKELIQDECNAVEMVQEMHLCLEPKRNAELQLGYQSLIDQLGSGGASERAALQVIGQLEQAQTI
jgi:lipid-A-disaccharide synthase